MSARPVSRPARPVRLGPAESDEILRLARRHSEIGRGHHNTNHVWKVTPSLAPLLGLEPGTKVVVRIRKADVLPVVVRTFFDEGAILRSLRDIQPGAPECLAEGHGFVIHSYVEGRPLSNHSESHKPVDSLHIEAVVNRLTEMNGVKAQALPPLPSGWPRADDSQEFWRLVTGLAEWGIRRPHWAEFGRLFTELGVPADALVRLRERVPALRSRPSGLLHGDLHRENLIVSAADEAGLVCIDWELATYGDPLYDLSTHLVRMQYPSHQWDEVIEAWATAALHRIGPAAVEGLTKDLSHYIAFERAQSVFPDVMRAAHDLGSSSDEGSLNEATASVRRALEAAEEPLRLPSVRSTSEIEQILFRWWAGRPLAPAGRRTTRLRKIDWQPDRRLPERPEFPHTAVPFALAAEGATPTHRFIEGTAHRNSVVWPAEFPAPVVMRRTSAKADRRERRYLSETAVLRAIEESDADVAAPTVLALGRSYGGERFAIHTYAGEPDLDLPPRHPVDGLLPRETDALVDQLCALTRVDHRRLDPAADERDFFALLCAELVRLVRELPENSLRMALLLGLPDADRLGEILSGRRVTRRDPALLHGDLHPWNLVRRDDDLLLTLIDWERALVGDPLYDLARHLYLTRAEPETRMRMFSRWAAGLDPRYTRDHLRDYDVYHGLEFVRSAYVDLDRQVTGAGREAPNVQRAVAQDWYRSTLGAALRVLGLSARSRAVA